MINIKRDVKDLLGLLVMKQEHLFKYILDKYGKYNTGFYPDNFIVLKSSNTLKPMLCVHLDTINDASNKAPKHSDFVYNKKKNTIELSKISRLSCVGGDDRCGVYLIDKYFDELIKKYHIGFFCDEEIGGVGSGNASKLLNEDSSISCFIGLDRKGVDEVATYGYDNKDLIEAFTSLGYRKVYGTFTDASNLASEGILACINLSVGYANEHTNREFITVSVIDKTAKTLLQVELIEDYYEADNMYKYNKYGKYSHDILEDYDDNCNEFSYLETQTKEDLGNCICCGTSNHKRHVIAGDVLCEVCLEEYF